MAGDAVVGALRVVLGMDTAQFEDGAKKAAHATESFGKRMLEVAAGIGLEKILESAKDGFIEFGKGALEAADQLYKMGQRTGIPVEELSGLKGAVELTGLSFETFIRTTKNLQIELTKAGSHAVTPAASAIRYLGLNIQDIAKAKPEDAIKMLSDAFSGLEDGTNKTAVAAALFGARVGGEMIPFLNKGADGIDHLVEEAQKLGLVISGDTAKNAEQFNESMLALGSITKGIALQALGPLSAGLADIGKKLIDWVNKTDIVNKAASFLVTTIKFVTDNMTILNYVLAIFIARLGVNAVISFGTALVTMATSIAKSVAALLLFNITSLITVARFAAIGAVVLLLTNNLEPFIDIVKRVSSSMAGIDVGENVIEGLKKLGINTDALTKAMDALGFSVGRVKISGGIKDPFDPEASKKAVEFTNKLRDIELQAKETAGEFNNTLAPGFLQAAQSLKVIKEDGSNLNTVLELGTKKAIDLNLALLTLEAAKLSQEFISPWDEYQKKLEKINLLLETQKINSDLATEAALVNGAKMASAYGQAASTIAGGFADAFKFIAEQNRQYAGIAKGLAIATALANTFVAATKALADTPGPLPLKIAAAVAVTAAGLANVAKIQMTQFAQGGSFKVGGAGGIDSQLVHFKASPGEMVDIRKPGSTGAQSEITIRGISSRDFFTGDMLRSMVEGLNSAYQDGYKLKFAGT